MSEIHHSQSPEKSIEGSVVRPATAMELAKAIDLAFDYRGDVTIELKSGERVEGYVFDRNADHSNPYIELFLAGKPGKQIIEYSNIAAIIFSGEDTASGKSWEAWIQKKREDEKK